MLIILSPAKTFKASPTTKIRHPIFYEHALKLVKKLKKLDHQEIVKSMQVSKTIAYQVLNFYQTFGETYHSAMKTYDGMVYKAFDMKSLDKDKYADVDQKIIILSGLYGIIKPFDTISHYRLEMQYKYIGSLYDYWHQSINDYLRKQSHQKIVSLASEEYQKIIAQDIDFYDIVFKTYDGVTYKSPSMIVKKMRGLMARAIIDLNMNKIENVKKIVIDNFVYDSNLSSEKRLVYVKKMTTK
jgi:uncharacterized protein